LVDFGKETIETTHHTLINPNIAMPESNELDSDLFTPIKIREIAYGFQSSRIFLTAYELGVFTALGDKAMTSAAVAKTLKTNPRATDRLMNALCTMDLLVKKGGKFSNTPAAAQLLVQGKPEYMAGFMHTSSLWNTWSTLTEAVRNGTTVAMRPHTNDRGTAWLSAFIAAMHDRAKTQAPAIVSLVDLSDVKRVLDVGGGSGAFSMAFARAGKNITATIFDLPNVLPLAKKYVKQAKLQAKIDFRAGDYLKDGIGSGYDIVFLSAIIHSNSEPENRTLFKKCAKALNPNGQLVIVDFIMDEERLRPPHGAFFSLNMLVGTRSGDTYTESEVRSWLNAAGLKKIKRLDTPFGTSMVIGVKST
jgi:2-polyprenyl-3-methyl-5-hydroxy-6-metoxy-1,4-benzoquinol methylase